MATLFSYVVEHDNGFAPNPYDGSCTLVHCKFRDKDKPRDIVELAEVGDWIIGTGGVSKRSTGHGTILYLMRVDEKLTFPQFLGDQRFKGRADQIDKGSGNEFALISQTFFYFGKNALNIALLPSTIPTANLAKKGPKFRRDYPEEDLKNLVEWFIQNFEVGMHGKPCAYKANETVIRKCVPLQTQIRKC